MLGYKVGRAHDINLVEQVLSQGEALRASIVQTILKNEPFYSENSKPLRLQSDSNDEKVALSLHEKHAFLAYINGDPMTREDEQHALSTFRSLSGSDICDLTAQSFSATQNRCKCETCRSYSRMSSNCVPPLKSKRGSGGKNGAGVKFSIQSSRKHDNFELFKYINSLKVVLHHFMISEEGKVKLCSTHSGEKHLKFSDLNITYFVEYEAPNEITKCPRKQSRVDTGLNSTNYVKKCSKNINKSVVHFKQVTIHDIKSLDVVNLDDVEMLFKVTARTFWQKKAIILGIGKFNFAEFCYSPTLNCLQEIPIYLTEALPIVCGNIKIQFQLGCDRLYFCQEFIDSLQCKDRCDKDEQVLSENLDETFTLAASQKSPKKNVPKSVNIQKPVKTKEKIAPKSATATATESTGSKQWGKVDDVAISAQRTRYIDDLASNLNLTPPNEKTILFGFIFVSDVEYQHSYPQTYFTCQPFCQQDFVCSNVTRGGSNTCFNYHQVIPYVYDEDFLFNLRENHMILEFFAAQSTTYGGDEVIGICKVPLHQYYLAFRNPVITKYLTRNNLPVIGTDWHEPVKDVTSGFVVGNAQVLVALGSEEQVRNLQKERGFMDDTVKRIRSVIHKNTVEEDVVKVKQKILVTRTEKTPKKQQNKTLQTEVKQFGTPRGKIDKATTVTPTLELSILSQANSQRMDECNKASIVQVDYRLQTIQDYLQQLVALKTSSEAHMQAQTNPTDSINAELQSNTQGMDDFNVNELQNGSTAASRTSTGFVETLQGVTNLETSTLSSSPARSSFKAHIVVESALHLPARKKCRARKIKGKVVREELLPSTYVSYEIKEGVVKTSQVVQKTTSPTWNLRNEVSVPIEYLTNSNRRLLFKVWRKSNNGSTIPNMQIDTIIGFATVDMTVLLAGLPTIDGWFNIMDFTNKCNGQIKINVTPLENILEYNNIPSTINTLYTTTPNTSLGLTATTTTTSRDIPASPDETFSRALKRKFIELEEISQRLKARLHHVTEDMPPEDDRDANDESADEFEKDINTLCVEEDYELLDFAKEAQDMNMRRVSSSLHQWQLGNPEQALMITTEDDQSVHIPNLGETFQQGEPSDTEELALQVEPTPLSSEFHDEDMKTFVPEIEVKTTNPVTNSSASSTSTLDRQLTEGRERIDHLLQRLTLLSSAQKSELGDVEVPIIPIEATSRTETEEQTFPNRYVSGCSTRQDPAPSASSSTTVGDTRNFNLEQEILNELGIDTDFDARKLFNASLESFNGNLETLLDRNFRDAPDGEGNTTESSSDDKFN